MSSIGSYVLAPIHSLFYVRTLSWKVTFPALKTQGSGMGLGSFWRGMKWASIIID